MKEREARQMATMNSSFAKHELILDTPGHKHHNIAILSVKNSKTYRHLSIESNYVDTERKEQRTGERQSRDRVLRDEVAAYKVQVHECRILKPVKQCTHANVGYQHTTG